MIHRGPDGHGTHVDGALALGHRRLAILDLRESGKQPMSYGGGRYWITYNGEVYNFLEIRAELEGLGHRFRSQSDTEVVLAAYVQWGTDCVLKFNGMWAFAIWDAMLQELFLSRDRFGVKPLHYLDEPGRFAFASELKAFLRLPGFEAVPDEDEMRRVLCNVELPGTTLLKGIVQLPAGHNLLVSANATQRWRWWRTLDHLLSPPRTFEAQVEQFRELFFDACQIRLRSDVPVATCLSGGMDSSSIVCTLSKLDAACGRRTRDYRRAFIATFDGTPHDEREFAQAAVDASGALAKFRQMEPAALVQDIRQFSVDFELIGQGLLLPVWALYRELRRDGVFVSLDGHGADEMLMGYGGSLLGLLQQTGGLLRHPFRTYDLADTVQRQFSDKYSLRYILGESSSAIRAGKRLWKALHQGERQRSNSPKTRWVELPETDLQLMDKEEQKQVKQLTPMGRLLYDQFHYTRLPSILRKYDRMSMGNGIEIRMPFMDWRLVCYTFSLPDEAKAGGGYSKRILREAMRGILPEKVRSRTAKIGFQSPLANWFNGGLAELVWNTVNSHNFVESTVWDGKSIREFVATRHAARIWRETDSQAVWRYIQAELWRESFFGLAQRTHEALEVVPAGF